MSMNKTRFNVIYLPTNQGLGNGLRVALENCSHKIVARMDADDIAVPNRFEKQLAFLTANPQTDIVGGQITEFAEDPTRPTGMRKVPLTDRDIKTYLKKRCPFNHMTVMFKKTAVEKAGGYQDWYCNEDYYLWARMALKGARFANVPEVLVNVRTGNGMSARRGGWKYFRNEAALQGYLWANHLIGLPRLIYNVALRFGGEVVLPNSLRACAFKFLRKNPSISPISTDVKHETPPTAYPPFSVAMCVYGKDHPTHFKTALESIINQTVPPTEIVIVVDGPVPAGLQDVLNYYGKGEIKCPRI